MSEKRSKTKFLLYPKFQLALIATSSFVTILTALVSTAMVYQSYNNLKAMGVAVQLRADHPYFEFLTMQSYKMYWALGIGAGISLFFSVVIMLFITHRLVGPLHRLRSYLTEIAKTGHVERPLKFRDGDYLEDLPEAVNTAFDAIKSHKDANKKHAS